MIDDNFNVVHGCRHAGFDVQEPQFVMGMIYEVKVKELEHQQMVQFDKEFHEQRRNAGFHDFYQRDDL